MLTLSIPATNSAIVVTDSTGKFQLMFVIDRSNRTPSVIYSRSRMNHLVEVIGETTDPKTNNPSMKSRISIDNKYQIDVYVDNQVRNEQSGYRVVIDAPYDCRITRASSN